MKRYTLLRENKGYCKAIAPDPGSCARDIGGCGGRTGTFFLLVHGPVPARRHV